MANGEVRNKDLEVRHWGIKRKGGGVIKSSTPQFHTSDMNSTPNSPSTIVPVTDNVPMDVESNLEAEQRPWNSHRPRSRFTPPMRLGRSVGRSRRDRRRSGRQRSWQP